MNLGKIGFSLGNCVSYEKVTFVSCTVLMYSCWHDDDILNYSSLKLPPA